MSNSKQSDLRLAQSQLGEYEEPRLESQQSYTQLDALQSAYDESFNEKDSMNPEMDQHKIPIQELYDRLGSDSAYGISGQLAQQRRGQEGENKLPQKEKTPAWIRFIREITNWFAIMLWIGSIMGIVTYAVRPEGNLPNLMLGIVLIFVVFLTGTITFKQNSDSEELMDGFKNMLPSVCRVIRDGQLTQVPAELLVRGDLVEINSGDKIPADLRVIRSAQMKVDNSALTGQAEPLLRSTECTHPDNPLETMNMVFFGTLCREGSGVGIVVKVADKTVMGQIADLAASGGGQKSPLRKELDRFVVIITCIALSLGVIFFLLALLLVKYSPLDCIIFGIGILVANVPEGLLACITISLAITAKKLSQKQVLVKNLEAVETLGSTSCLCSDKTGTLTQNKMTVEHLWIDDKIIKAFSKEVKGPDFDYEYNEEWPTFKALHRTAVICSSAKFDLNDQDIASPDFKYKDAPVMGDASETALIKFYQPLDDITATRTAYPVGKCKDDSDSKLLFNSVNKYALTIVREQSEDYHWVIHIKGAPEKVWQFCTRILYKGSSVSINGSVKKQFQKVNLQFGKSGERVLGFAKLPLDKDDYPSNFKFVTSNPSKFNFPKQGFTFIGLISLMDPPKESVPEAVGKCRSAGIKVVMVTGDQAPTAAAIAKQIGIIHGKTKTNFDLEEEGFSPEDALRCAQAIVVHGDMITKAFQVGDEEGEKTLQAWCNKRQVVFARTTPAQKLQIVKAHQNLGLVVGVTGDGVNDSPAIKQADIGISMGITGSDVTKDAADMILLNDDFSSIVEGVEEGRKIFDNLKKTIVYLLTSNITEIWPFVALAALQVPLPLSNIFILVIAVGTDIYPALSLAYEQAEVDVMTRRPRKPEQHLVSAKLLAHSYGHMGSIATMAGFFTYNIIMSSYGLPFSIYFQILSKNTYIPLDLAGNKFYQFNEAPTFGPGGYQAATPNLNTVNYYTNADGSTFQTCPSAQLNGNLDSRLNFPFWLSTVHSKVDLRVSYVMCCGDNYCPQFDWPAADSLLQSVSPITGLPVMFTTEALFYAQSGYFAAIVMVQWSNVFACKSRKMSLIYSAPNKHMFGGIIVETLLIVILLYVPGINKVFGGRPLPFFLLGIPGLGFSMLLLIWEESRKKLINWQIGEEGKPNWFQRRLLW